MPAAEGREPKSASFCRLRRSGMAWSEGRRPGWAVWTARPCATGCMSLLGALPTRSAYDRFLALPARSHGRSRRAAKGRNPPSRDGAIRVPSVRLLEPLSGDERCAFLDRYRDGLREAYPARPDGKVLLPYPRLFIVARRA